MLGGETGMIFFSSLQDVPAIEASYSAAARANRPPRVPHRRQGREGAR